MPNIATIRTHDKNRIAIESPYNRDFVTALKGAIDYADRSWDPGKKVWIVHNRVAELAIEIAREHYDEVIDARAGDVDVEEKKIEAEIEEIKAYQAYILENRERILSILDELGEIIGRYSFNSKSRIKAAYAKDRALLLHSLDNAEIPVDRLTELQVRGLAAAVRYLETAARGDSPKRYR